MSKSFKKSLKNSMLTDERKSTDREFLLEMSPERVCIKRDADLGCDQCQEFIDTYLSPQKCTKFTKSSMREMKV